jgi:hypothetical protein
MTKTELYAALKRNADLAARNPQLKSTKRRKIAVSEVSEADKSPIVGGQIRHGVLTNLAILLPIRTVSEMNTSDHWVQYGRRNKAQQDEVKVCLRRLFDFFRVELPCVVHLTRIGAQKLDPDNLASSFKHVQDAVASLIGIDDGSEMITWRYDQIVDRLAGYGIKIEILRPFQAEESR